MLSTHQHKKHLYGLDILRGLCAIMVALYHILSWDKIIDFTAVGYYGVYIFFILSGFSIHYQYKDKLVYIKDLTCFFYFRLIRLFPLLFLILIFLFFSLNFNRQFSLESFYYLFLTCSCFFGFGMPGATSVLTGGWSLGIEFCFYIMYPFFLVISKNLKISLIFMIFLLFLRIFFVKISYLLFKEYWWFGYTQVISFLFFFFSGMICSDLYNKYKNIKINLKNNYFHFFSFLFLFIILTFKNLEHQKILDGYLSFLLITHSVLCVFIFSLFSINRPVFIKISKFFGDISYGVYLIHPFIYRFLKKFNFSDSIYTSPFLCLIFSILISFIIKNKYEDPVRLALKRLFLRK